MQKKMQKTKHLSDHIIKNLVLNIDIGSGGDNDC